MYHHVRACRLKVFFLLSDLGIQARCGCLRFPCLPRCSKELAGKNNRSSGCFYLALAFTILKSYYSSHSLLFMKKRLSDTEISKGSFLMYYYVRRSTSFFILYVALYCFNMYRLCLHFRHIHQHGYWGCNIDC